MIFGNFFIVYMYFLIVSKDHEVLLRKSCDFNYDVGIDYVI